MTFVNCYNTNIKRAIQSKEIIPAEPRSPSPKLLTSPTKRTNLLPIIDSSDEIHKSFSRASKMLKISRNGSNSVNISMASLNLKSALMLNLS